MLGANTILMRSLGDLHFGIAFVEAAASAPAAEFRRKARSIADRLLSTMEVDRSSCGYSSYSYEYPFVAIVYAASTPVGIDIARVSRFNQPDIDKFFLTLSERKSLMTMPVSDAKERRSIFWVRKEAFGKATGEGLSERVLATDLARPPRGYQFHEGKVMDPLMKQEFNYCLCHMKRSTVCV